ncbi:MAG: site-specific integrase [Nitrososphaerales archaeon]
MMERYFKQRAILTRMRGGLLGPYLGALAQRLNDEGYGHETAQRHLSIVAAFSDWLRKYRVPINEIDWKHTQKYIRQRSQRKRSGVPVALAQIINLLHEQGVIDPKRQGSERSKLAHIEEYANYLRQERGLSRGTIQNYTRIAEHFLFESAAGEDLSKLCSADIIGFIQRQAPKVSRGRIKNMTTVLKSFLQYARYQGYVAADLAAAVPTVANWTMTGIPKALASEQVELLLSSGSRHTAVHRRDTAILTLLGRLGLRAGEIVALKLEDIDWDIGCIKVRGKGGRDSVLPLPPDVGEAIASYLQHERPRSTVRAMFLTGRAPFRALSGHSTVSLLVARALARAGIDSARRGAHQLRHSLACRVLNNGATLAEVGELLRHQNIQTTTIYAKVDLKALRTLAQPWPGGAQ